MLETLLHPMCLGNADNPKKKKKDRQMVSFIYNHMWNQIRNEILGEFAGNDFDILLLAHVVHYVTVWRACKRYLLYA